MGADQRGRVVRLHGKTAVVSSNKIEYACRVAGKMKQGKRTSRSPVAVGDWVRFEQEAHSLEDGEGPAGTIVEIEDRKTCLSRSSAHNTRLEQAVAANVDQLAIMVAANDIELHLGLVDRLHVAACMAGLTPILVVNKTDLCPRQDAAQRVAPYERFGLQIVYVSAQTKEGLDELRDVLKDRTTVFAGPSGVGKSTCLNALDPSLTLRTGDVRKSGAGKHTTTSVSLLPLPWGGYVVDTPGVREFGLWNIPKDELGLWYPDFTNYRTACRYPGCTHTHEPECAVRTACERNEIDRGRYERYVELHHQLVQEEESTRY